MKLKLKVVCVAALIALGATAQATPFYLDLGTNYSGAVDPDAPKTGGPTTTGTFTDALYKYNSKTFIYDANVDGILSVGDTVLGTGGVLKADGVTTAKTSGNFITGFDPQFGPGDPGGPNANGFGPSWGLSLGWNDLTGSVGAGLGINYTSGTIHVYLRDAGYGYTAGLTEATAPGSMLNVLDFHVTSGGNNGIGQSLNLQGTVEVKNGATVIGGTTVNDLFHFADTGVSFGDIALGLVSFSSNQNTDPFRVNGGAEQSSLSALDVCQFYGLSCALTAGGPVVIDGSGYDGEGTLEGKHDGSVSFAVPEPGSLAMVGLGLVGLAALRRRKLA